MESRIKNAVNSVNDWAKMNSSKIFRDSYGIPFRVVGADAREYSGIEYIALHIMHRDGTKTVRPLNAFKDNGNAITPDNLINVLNKNTLIDGKSTFDITDKINAWVKKNPYKYFIDKSGVEYIILGATPPNTVHLMSKAGIKADKKTTAIFFNKEPLTHNNVYQMLTNNNRIDSQIFYGNIVQHVNKWVAENPDKWFQNGETGKFKVLGAKLQNGITLLMLENDAGVKKNIALNKLVFNNQKMAIGNVIEFFTLATKFDNTIRFGDEVEIANKWLKEANPTFFDKNGMPFKIDQVVRDKNSQILFKITSEQGQSVSRNAYSFTHSQGVKIQDGNITAFLQSAKQFDNAVIFENSWQQGRLYQTSQTTHYLPPFDTLKKDSLLRLPNGQCAKVIDTYLKQTSSIKQKMIDIIVEDGTVIKGISKTRYEGNLININTNRPVLNILPLLQKGKHDDRAIRRELKQLNAEKTALGNRSEIEFKYFYYLKQLGFSVSDPLFFQKYFNINDRRSPDSYLLKNGKMIIFEFDGASGHGGVHHKIEEDIARDNQKNKVYSIIVENAKKGEYLPDINSVTVIRVRGNNVPLLNPRNVQEITYPKCTNEETMIPETVRQIANAVDSQTGLTLSINLNKLYPNGIDMSAESDDIDEFVDEMLGKNNADKDKRVGEVSQMIGCGTDFERTGQYMMILKIEYKEKGKMSDNDKVTVAFEDGNIVRTSYEKFKNGTVNSNRFNKVLDYSSRKLICTTVGEVKKQQDFAHSIEYYDSKTATDLAKNDARMTFEEISLARHLFPVVNNAVIDGQKNRNQAGLLSNFYNSHKAKTTLADQVLESDLFSGIPTFTTNPSNDKNNFEK